MHCVLLAKTKRCHPPPSFAFLGISLLGSWERTSVPHFTSSRTESTGRVFFLRSHNPKVVHSNLPVATNRHLCRPRILAANFYAATSMRNVIWGVIEPWLQCASRAPESNWLHGLPY